MAKKQKDGRYRSKITIGYKSDGTPITKYVSGKTKRELEEAKQAARAYYIDGTALRNDTLFGTYAIEWYKAKKEPFIGEATRVNYRACLNKHILPVFGGRNLRAIRAIELQEWLNEYEGMGKTTISLLVSILKNIYENAMAENIVNTNVAATLIKPKAKQPAARRALTDEETQGVLHVISTHQEGLYLAILYYLGLRRGEGLGLKWGDFSFSERLVHVQRDIDYSTGNGLEDSLKTDESDRFVTLPAQLLPMLVNHRGPDDQLLFTAEDGKSIMAYNSYRRMWIRLMIEAGIAVPVENPKGNDILDKWDTPITPHYLRHNYITMLYEAGVDMTEAMKLVGHRDIQTTINIYTHLKEEHLKKATAKIDHVFKKVAEKLPSGEIEILGQKEKR